MNKDVWEDCSKSVQKVLAIALEGAVALALVAGLLFSSWWAVEKVRGDEETKVTAQIEKQVIPVQKEVKKVKTISKKAPEVKEVKSFVTKASGKAGETIIPFGKYNGQSFEEISKTERGLSYLGWISTQDWLFDDLKLSLKDYFSDPKIDKKVKDAVASEQETYDNAQAALTVSTEEEETEQ